MTTDYYQQTCDRLEPDIAMIDAGAFFASAAVSLKRIADSLDVIVKIIEDARIIEEARMTEKPWPHNKRS